MTKKARILELLANGRTTSEVAEIVGCRSEYVRTVRARQNGDRPCDLKWRAIYIAKQAERYRTDPEFRRRMIESATAWAKANPLKRNAQKRRNYARKSAQEMRS